MRIAFVGKGGSGKSTLTAAFSSFIFKRTNKPVVVFDADLNIDMPKLLGFGFPAPEQYLSEPEAEKTIKRWLIGHNPIKNLSTFRKSTPPTKKSNILALANIQDTPLAQFGSHRKNLSLFVIGTYQTSDIGASCYHNNLAVFENILSHTNDIDGYLIVDMVAGVDAFAGTLHTQFDLICVLVEPTMRSLDVYINYKKLAKSAGVASNVTVIANKIRNENDLNFIKEHVKNDDFVGYLTEDDHIRYIDQTKESLECENLHADNQALLKVLEHRIHSLPDNRDVRLHKLWDLHKKYVSQSFIKDRFGDLTSQIDSTFSYRQLKT